MTHTDDSCPITVWPRLGKVGRTNRGDIYSRSSRCGDPLAEGALFCAKHEADRIRLAERRVAV